MARTQVPYEKALPEISGRRAWEEPNSHLVKTGGQGGESEWKVKPGRRQSELLLVPRLRAEVGKWRANNYAGASATTQRLFMHWFEEEHRVAGFEPPFHYHFCQREAMETLVWLLEVAPKARDAKALIRNYGGNDRWSLHSQQVQFETAADGERMVRRLAFGESRLMEQELPPENLPRFAFNMATGSGKTWVMAMAALWSYFHKQRETDSPLSQNFLIVAPNVIVYQRLEKDFSNNAVFKTLPLIPPEWRADFHLKVILRGDAAEPDPSGNLFLTNIHQLYDLHGDDWVPANPAAAMLGKSPARTLTSGRTMLERVKTLPDLAVMNDEAHHVHHRDLRWNQSLRAAHAALPNGLAMWLDFSATPKDQGGRYFPWIITDYPLAQAVEDRIVKAPIIVTKEREPDLPEQEPGGITKENVAEKYRFWLRAAVARWREHAEMYRQLNLRPVLFVMAEKTSYADAIGKALCRPEYGFKPAEVLVIHTNTKGEIIKKDLDKARRAVRQIDDAESKIKAIVSVMMLHEGWDVRNVSVVLGLRPFSARAKILPTQFIGRGLRPMKGVGPERTQTLEVLGTRKLLDALRDQLEADGVSVISLPDAPPEAATIRPIRERAEYDIQIPMPEPDLIRATNKLDEFDPYKLEAVYEHAQLRESLAHRLYLEALEPGVGMGTKPLAADELWSLRAVLNGITREIMRRAGLVDCFAALYPKVRDYIEKRCFGLEINLEKDEQRFKYLQDMEIRDGIAKYLAREIGKLTAARQSFTLKRPAHSLMATKAFRWRRDLPPLQAEKTVFNYVATYNKFERGFAEFLDRAPDVLRFAALAAPEQGGSGVEFHINYLKPSGAIGMYFPDWVAVQKVQKGLRHWIVETKGYARAGTAEKDEAMQKWCARVSNATGADWRYIRINQKEFEIYGQASTLAALIKNCAALDNAAGAA